MCAEKAKIYICHITALSRPLPSFAATCIPHTGFKVARLQVFSRVAPIAKVARRSP